LKAYEAKLDALMTEADKQGTIHADAIKAEVADIDAGIRTRRARKECEACTTVRSKEGGGGNPEEELRSAVHQETATKSEDQADADPSNKP